MTEPSEQVAVNRLPFSVRKPGTPAGCGIAVMEEAGMLGSTEPAVSSLPDHLVEADGVHWAFWRTACLRGAGFPSHLIRNLTAPACAHAADEVLATERETEQRRTEAAAAYRKELTQTGNEEQRKTLTSALKRLSKGKLPDAAPESVSELSRQRLAAAMVRAADAKKRFQ